jgi:carbamoyltransferase
MRVLGISPLDKDSTVSFVEDGQIVFACGEERLSRAKLQNGFPHQALKLGLERTGWGIDKIDRVAYSFFEGAREAELIDEAFSTDRHRSYSSELERCCEIYRKLRSAFYKVDRTVLIPGIKEEREEFLARKSWIKRAVYDFVARRPSFDHFVHNRIFEKWKKTAIEEHVRWTKVLHEELEKLGLIGKLVRFHHHDTHAANAFYASGLDQALCVVMDGYGSGCSGGVFLGDRDGVKPLHRFNFPASLGIFYEQVTSGLGFRPSRHEGKIVGLAAYGNPSILGTVLRSRFIIESGDIKIAGAQNSWLARALGDRFAKRDIAAAYQRALEEVTCECVAFWLQKTGMKNVVMSGGVHANVKLNQRVVEIPGVESAFVYPNMGDGGCATGAAFLASGHLNCYGKPFSTALLGPSYSESEVIAELTKNGLKFESLGDKIEPEIAKLLASDSIVARVNGRMEYGPRALCNRSILYPAKRPEVNQWLNEQLGRTEFMPFAPVCLAEEADKLFKNFREGLRKTSEYMTITFDCTDEMKNHSPAAVHVDGTARPQLVSEESNSSMYRILCEYNKLTGIPVLISTSFNMHEEPIVCTPADSIRAFLLGNIDYLAIGGLLVKHPSAKRL